MGPALRGGICLCGARAPRVLSAVMPELLSRALRLRSGQALRGIREWACRPATHPPRFFVPPEAGLRMTGPRSLLSQQQFEGLRGPLGVLRLAGDATPVLAEHPGRLDELIHVHK